MNLPVWILGLAALVQIPPPQAASEANSALRADRQAIRDEETAKLQALADRLARQGRAAEAEEARTRIEPAPPRGGPTRFVTLPDVVPAAGGLANVPTGSQAPAEGARAELLSIRGRTAKALFELAGRAAKARRFAMADDCLRGVLDRQPDHAEARRLLGFVPHAGGWGTPYAVARLKKGEVLHPVFEWVEADWVPHLEKGELPAPNQVGQTTRWLPAAEADALRRDWKPPWRISTEHFFIQTNVPLSDAIAFGRRLEDLHELFFALLADVIGPERLPLAQRYSKSGMVAKVAERRHPVCYFATREEYVDFLRTRIGPGLGGTLGFYLTPNQAKASRATPTSYLFKDEGGQLEVTATLYHEVSHQLLFESSGKSRYEENAGNFWVFEGLGTYFETLIPQPDGSLSIGGLIGPRIAEAKKRLLEQHEYIPIEYLVGMSNTRFSGDDGGDVHLHYAEAMALTAFFMQFDGGRYRDDFLDYVENAYRGQLKRGTSHTLEARLGVPYATLDKQFLEFLKADPKVK